MRLKRFGDWIEYTTESGKTFYYNDRDGSFQWEHPLGPEHTPQANRAAVSSNTSAKVVVMVVKVMVAPLILVVV